MKFDKILQYQKIDQEVNALKAEMAKSDAYQKFQDSQAKLESATKYIGTLTDEANELLKSYETMKSKMEALKSQLAEFDGVIEDMQDVSEADYYLKLIGAISDKLNALEKEANGVSNRLEQISAAYTKTWSQGVKASQINKAAKAEYNAFAMGYNSRFEDLKKKLSVMAADIPKEELAEYLTLKKSKKLPVYVEYDAANKACGRCRMEVPNDLCSKLKAPGDYAECPNCRRIMYVPEEK